MNPAIHRIRRPDPPSLPPRAFSVSADPESFDQEMMLLAMEQARAAEAAGEIPVGAVILSPQGDVLALGENRVLRDSDPTAHAEMVALRAAGEALRNYRLVGCTLYSTLEPCAMCAGAMIHARIARLVFGALDPKTGAVGSVLQVLNHPQLNHQMELTGGVLADQCGDQLRRFFQGRREARTQEPF